MTSEIKLDYIYWKFTARDHWYLKCNKPFNHYNNPMYWVHYDSHFRGKEAVSQRGQVLAWVPSHIYMGAQPELNLHNWILTCLLASSCGHILYDSVWPESSFSTGQPATAWRPASPLPRGCSVPAPSLPHRTEWSFLRQNLSSPPCPSFLVMLFPWKCQATLVWVEKNISKSGVFHWIENVTGCKMDLYFTQERKILPVKLWLNAFLSLGIFSPL